jgi:hypothetical protein
MPADFPLIYDWPQELSDFCRLPEPDPIEFEIEAKVYQPAVAEDFPALR